jgi:hypothetical protein
MRVAIVGSRDYTDGTFIEMCVRQLSAGDYVVSGGASGADFLAEKYAMRMGVSRIIHEAYWAKHGKSAGPIRNSLIVKDSDCVLAFYTNRSESRGTLNCVSQAKSKGIPVFEYDAATEAKPEWLWTWYKFLDPTLYGEESRGYTEQSRS